MLNTYKEKDQALFAEVAKLMKGDESSYQKIYELSEKYIYKIIHDIVKDHHTTEDIMQDTYVQIYNKINTLQSASAFYVWAGRIATNFTLRHIQKNRREVIPMADEEGSTDFVFEKATDDTENFIPENVLMDREKQRLIGEIVDRLSVEQKLSVQYFYYEEMSVSEIAQAMGCSTGTVKSRLNYARKSIKEAVIDLDVNQGTRLYSLAAAPLFLMAFRVGVADLIAAGVGTATVAGAVSMAGAAGGNAAVASGASVAGEAVVGSASVVGEAVTEGTVAGNVATGGASVATNGNVASNVSSKINVQSENIEKVRNIAENAGEKAAEKFSQYKEEIIEDVKKAGESAKEIFNKEKENIVQEFAGNKTEGFKQLGQSIVEIGKNVGKGFITLHTSSKIVMIFIFVLIVAVATSSNRKVMILEEVPLEEIIEEEIVEDVTAEEPLKGVEEVVVFEEEVKDADIEEEVIEWLTVSMCIAEGMDRATGNYYEHIKYLNNDYVEYERSFKRTPGMEVLVDTNYSDERKDYNYFVNLVSEKTLGDFLEYIDLGMEEIQNLSRDVGFKEIKVEDDSIYAASFPIEFEGKMYIWKIKWVTVGHGYLTLKEDIRDGEKILQVCSGFEAGEIFKLRDISISGEVMEYNE